MKLLFILVSLVAMACVSFAGEDTKPKLKVAPDGFPAGHETPEGVACDLARAFIKRDTALFSSTCNKPYASGGKGPANYVEFLKGNVEGMKAEVAKKEPSEGGPKTIAKVFAARHLSKNGPASYGYATFGFQDVMFVDVEVILHDGERSLNRTLVIKHKDGTWYVHPMPTAGSGLLGIGLNDESDSKKDFSEHYDVTK